MNLRVPVRTFEVVNFLNLAVRTHKPKTFEMLNHHEPNVALDAAQGRPAFLGKGTSNEGNAITTITSAQQALATIAAQGHRKNQSYSC